VNVQFKAEIHRRGQSEGWNQPTCSAWIKISPRSANYRRFTWRWKYESAEGAVEGGSKPLGGNGEAAQHIVTRLRTRYDLETVD
jgi:hypothetical protein